MTLGETKINPFDQHGTIPAAFLKLVRLASLGGTALLAMIIAAGCDNGGSPTGPESAAPIFLPITLTADKPDFVLATVDTERAIIEEDESNNAREHSFLVYS